MKRFKTTGICNPDTQYMVDINDKIEQIKKLIQDEKYFIIERPRGSGKSTILSCLKKELINDYLVISISFKDMSFDNGELFYKMFLNKCAKAIENLDKESSNKLLQYSTNNDSSYLRNIKKIIETCDKEVVLIIDDADTNCNNRVFVDFLGVLRCNYLERDIHNIVTFKSVIFSCVNDISNIKLENVYNSPFNIVTPFKVDLNLSKSGIESMLNIYKNDRNIELDTNKIANFIYTYTKGYPFLVSRICQIIDEDLNAVWNDDNLIEAVRILASDKNVLFDNLISNIENNEEFRNFMYNLVMNNASHMFCVYNSLINLGIRLGCLDEVDGMVSISNIIFYQVLYKYFLNNIK